MIKKQYILMMMVVMLLILTGCSNDDDRNSGYTKSGRVTVPIELCTNQTITESRAIGDPGFDDALPSTKYIYAWAVYQTSDSKWSVEYKMLENASWSDDNNEQTASHYKTEDLQFAFTNLSAGGADGKVYVVASNKALTTDQLKAIYTPQNAEAYNYETWSDTGLTADPNLKEKDIDLQTWTGDDLRDLYSNPKGDTVTDSYSLGNGVVKKSGTKVTVGTVRLYHCAAKVDFKWEVAETLRSTTSVASITCTGLPTTLKVFEPTANQDGTGTAPITTNTGNKWIGRAYAYVLQPAAGTISYSVAFAGSANRQQKNSTTPAAPTSIYTTWYRVVAEVK